MTLRGKTSASNARSQERHLMIQSSVDARVSTRVKGNETRWLATKPAMRARTCPAMTRPLSNGGKNRDNNRGSPCDEFKRAAPRRTSGHDSNLRPSGNSNRLPPIRTVADMGPVYDLVNGRNRKVGSDYVAIATFQVRQRNIAPSTEIPRRPAMRRVTGNQRPDRAHHKSSRNSRREVAVW